jgi:hypothetical protein
MRKADASVATWVLALILAVGLPATTWATPQAAADNGSVADAGESGQPATAEPGSPAASKKEDSAAGTAQAFAGPSGFGQLLGSMRVDGDVQVGYRFVSVNGSENKYREQYDIQEGVRILSTRVVVSPDQRGPGSAFDRITLSANGLGGDPYESWRIGAEKNGRYNANVRYRSVDYFFEDLGDPHAWDSHRNYLDADLRVNLASNVLAYATFSGYNRGGERTTTRDFDRDEFHFEEPLDQEATDYGFGIRWNLKGTDLFFNQSFVNFRDNSGFTSTANAGGSTATYIDMLANSEVRAMDAPISTGGFHSVVMDRVELFGDVIYSDQQTSSAFVQLIDGVDRSGNNASTTWSNQGMVQRQVFHANFDARILLTRQFIVTAKYRHRDWDQDGNSIGQDITVQTDDGTGSASSGMGLSSYQVLGNQILVGAEFIPSRAMSIFGEVGYSSYEKSFDKSTVGAFPRGSDTAVGVTTTTVPFRIGGYFRPDQRIDVKATFSRSDADDPLTQIFPTVADGFKLRARFRPMMGWTVASDFTYRDAASSVSAYQFDGKTFAASLSHAVSARGHASVGYTYLSSDSSIPFTYVADDRTIGETVSSYDAQTNVFTVGGRYEVSTTVPAELYGNLSWVDNNGTMPIGRWDVLFGGRYTFPRGIFIDAQFRFMDYQQAFFHEQGMILAPPEPSTVNDFDAKVFTIGLGFSFQ